MTSASQWYVYMIRTQDAQLYTGITTDIQRRWHEHCSGKLGSRYLRANKPQSVIWLEMHADRSSASKREAQIKKLGKNAKEEMIKKTELSAEITQLLMSLTSERLFS